MATSNFTTFNNNWTYCAQEGYISAGTFKNTNSQKIQISSVSLWLGTLSGYVNAGDIATGNGKAISTTVKIGSTVSSSVSVTATTGTAYDSSVGYYPTHKNNPEYKFPISVTVNAGETITIYVYAPNGINTSTGNCLTKTQGKGTVTYEVVPDYYTVSYNANGGTGAPASQQKTHDVDLTLSSTKPTKSSIKSASYRVTFNANGGTCDTAYKNSTKTTTYSFTTWNEKSDGSGAGWFAGGTYSRNASITLYAMYTDITLQDAVGLPGASRTGYSFKGWAESASATSGDTILYYPKQNITLYATWEKASITVTYNANGGTGAPSATSGVTPFTLSSTKPTKSQTTSGSYRITLNANGGSCDSAYITSTRRTSYTFDHWNTKSDNSGDRYNAGATYSGLVSITLYAIYSSSTKADSVALPAATRPGYTHTGWSTSSTASSGAQTYTPTSDVTLYATWRRNPVSITYNANGGSNVPSDQTGVPPLTISSTTPNRSNCQFKCWNTKSDGSGTNYNPGDSYDGVSNLSLYAIWRYKFTIGGSDGNVVYNGTSLSLTYSSDSSTLSAYLDRDTTINLSEFTFSWDMYSGKTLQSWNTKSDSSGTKYSLTQTLIISDVLSLYAISAPLDKYTVSFYDGKTPTSSLIKSVQKEYGSTLAASEYPDPPTWAGHKFSGWVGGSDIVMQNMSITAMWGMSPVWIMTTSGWAKYTPKEKK